MSLSDSITTLIGLAVFAALWIVFSEQHALRERLATLEIAVPRPRAGADDMARFGIPEVASEEPSVAQRQTFQAPPASAAAFVPGEIDPVAREAQPAGFARPATQPAGGIWGRSGARAFDWELFAGGRLLNAAGALILVIGIGLFLKYAFDRNWIDETARVCAGAALGIGLLIGGAFAHRREGFRWFAQGVLGAGLGVLYVSAYGAFVSYHLISFPLAYAFMSAVTIAAFMIALRYDSLALALIGWAGGFATPLALGDSYASEVGLASYILLLDIGLVAIASAKRSWFALEPLALFASYSVALAWFSQHGAEQDWAVSALSLTSLFGVFFAAETARALRDKGVALDAQQIVGPFNLLAYWLCLSDVMQLERGSLELVSLLVAGAYAVAYGLVVRRAPAAVPVRVQFYLSGIALVYAATALRYHGFSLPAMLAAEALGLALVERLLRAKPAYAGASEAGFGSAALLGAASLAFVSDPRSLVHAGPAWSAAFGSRDLALGAIAAGFFGIDRLLAGRATWPEWLAIVTRQLGLLAAGVLTAVHFEGFNLALAYALESLAVLWLGTRSLLRDLELDGLFGFALAAAVVVLQPGTWFEAHVFAFEAIRNGRFVAIEIFGLALLAGSELVRRRSLLPGAVARVLRAAGALTLVAGASLDVRDFFERALAEARLDVPASFLSEQLARLAGGEQLAISALWTVASLALIAIGIRFRIRDLRLLAIGLFDATILKAFFVDLGSLETIYRIVAFIGLGLVLLGVSYIYQRLEHGFLGPRGASDSREAAAA